MGRGVLILGSLLAGVAAGGGAAFGVRMAMPVAQAAATPTRSAPVEFVPTGAILAPLVFEDGQLAGYTFFELQLQVPADRAAGVAADMPLLLHAINLQTYRTPLATGPDGQLPDLTGFRRLVAAAADRTFGRGTVRRIAITQARPA